MSSVFRIVFILFLGSLTGTNAFAQDTAFVTVHVIYGSKPNAPGENKWFGGKWGGHVGLEIYPGNVVHFNPGGKVKAFRKNSPPGTYSESSVEDFYCTFGCDTVKTMQVRIPVRPEYRDSLKKIAAQFTESPPYPYAFFGMRCTAACYHMLSYGGVYQKKSENYMLRRFFYPRRLRKFLIKEAKKNSWQVTISEGTKRRKWDHD